MSVSVLSGLFFQSCKQFRMFGASVVCCKESFKKRVQIKKVSARNLSYLPSIFPERPIATVWPSFQSFLLELDHEIDRSENSDRKVKVVSYEDFLSYYRISRLTN